MITDPEVHARVLSELEAFVRNEPLGLVWRGVTLTFAGTRGEP